MLRAMALAGAALVALASSAIAKEAPKAQDASGVRIGEEGNGFSRCEERYLSRYVKAYEAGLDVGRNKVDDGIATKRGTRPASDAEACEAAARLHLLMHPPEPPPAIPTASAEVTSGYTAPSYTPTYSGTSWDAVAQCESGGDWSIATGNGYYGGLQMDSAFWNAYGNPAYGEANEAPPADQIAAAEAAPYDAWPNC